MPWLPSRASIALIVVTGPVVAQTGDDALAAFRRAFRPAKGAAGVEARAAALAAAGVLDSGAVAAALIDGWAVVDAEADALAERRAAANRDIAELLDGVDRSRERFELPDPDMARFRQLDGLVAVLREQEDALRALQAGIGDRLGELQSGEAVAALWAGAERARYPLPLRLLVARAAGALADEPAIERLHAALVGARRSEDRLVALAGVRAAGRAAAAVAGEALELLDDREQAVREAAAAALAKLAAPEAIAPLIDLLERENGPTRERVGAHLGVLTGEAFGTAVASWRAWYAAHRDRLLGGEAQLGGGMFEIRRGSDDAGYYFDIPQNGGAIVYVIDCSGSMREEIELHTRNSAGAPARSTRLAACKSELVAALRRLQKGQRFAIVRYDAVPQQYLPKLTDARAKTVRDAVVWVEALQAADTTNIHDALQVAFAYAGQGARDRYYGVEVDTIFLLTDGSPTKPDGSLDDSDAIIESVRRWNPLRRVTIHTIGIGEHLNFALLEQLAAENHGEFKRY